MEMRTRRRLTALLLLTAAALAGLNKPVHADGVDDYFKAQMAAQHIPGLSVAVVQDGKIVKEQGYGLSSLAAKTPATAETVYQIASLTKQFTAVAILQLVQQKKIGIDEIVAKYIDGLPLSWKAVTVRELLNQTSGIPDYMKGFDLGTQVGPTPKDYTASELIGLVDKKPLLFVPGTEFRYSNTNYHLLGMVIEKVTGKSYGDFMQATIFDPLAMSQTQMARPGLTAPNAARGTVWDGKTVADSPIVPSATISFGDTGVQTSVLDLVKWNAVLDSDTLLGADTKRLLWTPPLLTGGAATPYASGWVSASVRGHALLWHNGATFSGFSGAIFKFPSDKLTLIVLTNWLDLPDVRTETSTYLLTLGLAKLYLPDLAKEETGIPDTDPKTAALLKIVSAQIASGTLDKSLFTPAYQPVLTPEALQPLHDLLAPLGPMTLITLLRRDPDGSAVYRARYGTATVNWLIAVDSNHKILAIAGRGVLQ